MTVSRLVMAQTDLNVSRFSAGFWRLNDWKMSAAELKSYIYALLDLGITTMDHAFVYRSEHAFGQVLKSDAGLREKIELVSKFGIRPCGFGALGATSVNHYDSSPDYLYASVDNSLQQFHTEYLDVLLVHRPDYLMSAQVLAEAFRQLRAAGKVMHFGVSNFSSSQFDLLQSQCDFPLVTNQIEFSPVCLAPLDNGVLDQCQRLAVSPMLWSCLGGGRILSGDDSHSVRIRRALEHVAQQLGVSQLDTVVYAWLLKHPSRPLPIVGSRDILRIKNAVAAESLAMSREQWYAIWEACSGHAVP